MATASAKISKISPGERKYKKIEELKKDLQLRLELALEEGADPLGQFTIKQLAEDLEFISKLPNRTINSDSYIEGE